MAYDFLKQQEPDKPKLRGRFKILIADDDPEVHVITKMVLKDFVFEDKGLEFFDTYSGEETKQLMATEPDIAVVFLDVVMEDTHAGLKVVAFIRETLDNHHVRIILRTGQPGEAPEETVIRDYDINDYRLKTEITVSRLYTIMYTALRGYSDLRRIELHKKGLERIILSSANIFKKESYNEFLTSILTELGNFYEEGTDLIYLRDISGFVALEKNEQLIIVAATGKYEALIGRPLMDVPRLAGIHALLTQKTRETQMEVIEDWYIIRSKGSGDQNNIILIEDPHKIFDVALIKMFLSNYSVALDNYILNNLIYETQREIIVTLGEVVEKHFDETSQHVNRMSEMMYRFAKVVGYPHMEAEMIKVGSTLHDVGKIGIPDAILKKPGKLTPEEFTCIKEHTEIGHKILSRSDLEILSIAAEIALNHHEKFDGSGYPSGLKGEGIPKLARMLAILDVFDAMTHKRVYKEAAEVTEALEYITKQKDRHFDPELVELFMGYFEFITGRSS